MRTLILGLAALVLGALALRAGAQLFQAAVDRPSALYRLGSALDEAGPLHPLPVRVIGLIQEVIGRPIGRLESAATLACILFEAMVVGVVLQLALADRSFGLVVNSLLALAGAWGVMLVYDHSPGADGFGELDALIARGVVASVVAPAALILVKTFAVADADTFLSGGDTRAGDAMRGLVARIQALASAAGRRPKGPSAERIRGVVDRHKS